MKTEVTSRLNLHNEGNDFRGISKIIDGGCGGVELIRWFPASLIRAKLILSKPKPVSNPIPVLRS